MHGLEWRNRIDVYWVDNVTARNKRKCFEEPYGDVKHVVGHPFGRQILSCRFENDREIQFNTRDHHEVSDTGEEDGDYRSFEPAIGIEKTWDLLIKEFWKRANLRLGWAQDHDYVRKMIERQSLEYAMPPAVDEKLTKGIEKVSLSTGDWYPTGCSEQQSGADTPMRGT